MRILLVEPDYKAKFPPLGLARLSSFHKNRGDDVAFVRGMSERLPFSKFDRIYISSLFTYELPKTVATLKYYSKYVENPFENLIVGGIGATLLPEYITRNITCKVIIGPLDQSGLLGLGEPPIAGFIPDYEMFDNAEFHYLPDSAYFVRVTQGCIRKCNFCAVPIIEPEFGYLGRVTEQVKTIEMKFGVKRDLVIMDNNILAVDRFPDVVEELVLLGFNSGAHLFGKARRVDFNQGLDARLVTEKLALLLEKLCVSPIRLAFDNDSTEVAYRNAVQLLANKGLRSFTTYVMYNFLDNPESFYHRLSVNLELSSELGINVTGFPMRYVPIDDVARHYISPHWTWKYLRGVQCILNATHGMVSPNPEFFFHSFGKSSSEFIENISMPDEYIIYRSKNIIQAEEWRVQFRRFSEDMKVEFLRLLGDIHLAPRENKMILIREARQYKDLLFHYFPSYFK